MRLGLVSAVSAEGFLIKSTWWEPNKGKHGKCNDNNGLGDRLTP